MPKGTYSAALFKIGIMQGFELFNMGMQLVQKVFYIVNDDFFRVLAFHKPGKAIEPAGVVSEFGSYSLTRDKSVKIRID